MLDQKSTILITGGAGFIGSTLVRQTLLAGAGCVVTLDKLTYAGHRISLDEVLDDPRHVFVEGDVCDGALVARLLDEHRPIAVVHLAAETHVDRSIEKPPPFVVTNVLGTCTLLDATMHYFESLDSQERSAFRLLLVSTDEVFGEALAGSRFDEASPYAPNSPYAASKAAGEQLARAYHHTFGLPLLIANPSNNYGPRQHPEKLIPTMILAAAAQQPLPLYGDGLHERDWIHVSDCCRALIAILQQGTPGDRFLIGADCCRTNLEVVHSLCDLVDARLSDGANRRALVTSVSDRPGHDRRYAVDSGLLKISTGWEPEVEFSRGLNDTVDWYLKNPDWVQEVLNHS